MKYTFKGGILIGIFCAIWQLIMGLTGWFLHPVLLNLFWMVIIIQVCILFWGLKKTSMENSYWQQVGAGTLMSFNGGLLLFIFSILFTTIFFPNYFNDLRLMQEQILKEAGNSESEIKTQVELASQMQTPIWQALFGLLGTVFTGFIASLIIGAFLRKK
jgi:hypothetical protein